MKMQHIAGVLGAVMLLAGCASNLQQVRSVQPSGGSAFTQALAAEYRGLAVHEADEDFDWKAADYFAGKGLSAAGGEPVLPEEVSGVSDDHAATLNDARGRLMAALDGGARESAPDIAAKAQVSFDCWLHETQEVDGWLANGALGEDHLARCRDDFEAAMAQLAPKPAVAITEPSPNVYLVLFDFDKSNINDAAQAVINQVIADFNANKSTAVSVTGHTDRAGSDAYNEKLSERRADAVREALIAGGIPAEAITTAWKGESENAVPTEDGVKEQANRRAEIIIQ
jgi:OOP family OmpA-OmpF porin